MAVFAVEMRLFGLHAALTVTPHSVGQIFPGAYSALCFREFKCPDDANHRSPDDPWYRFSSAPD
jgi:hypothetical protein